MKKIIVILAVVIIGLFLLGIVRDQIIKTTISTVATQITGAKVTINDFSLSIFRQSVRIRGLKLYNPKGFSDGVIIDLPKVSVGYDLPALLFKRKLHLTLLDVDLKELGLEKNKEGKLNVDSLKIAQQDKVSEDKKPSKQMPMQMDLVNLQMGRVVSRDYSVGKEPLVQVYDINLKKSYKDITSPQQLAALILTEPMKQAGIKGAAIYGVSALAGVAILPVAVVATFAGRDSVQETMDISIDKLYDISLGVLKHSGNVDKQDKASGVISAVVGGSDVDLKLKQVSAKSTQITISARKFMLPRPEIANGILYQINEEIGR